MHASFLMRGDKRPAILYLIPATVVLVALIALVAFPWFVNNQTNRMRRDIDSKAQPARAHLNQVNYELSVQVANLLRWSATEDERELDAYRNAGSRRRRAMDLLAKDIALMRESVPRSRFRELQQKIAYWEEGVDRQLRERTRGATAQEIFAAERSRFTLVIEQEQSLDEAIGVFESERLEEVRRLMRLELWITAALVLVALIAAAAVLWLFRSVRRLAGHLEEESAQRLVALEREREARATAEALVKARDEILGIVSHDLRSPLTTITLSTQLLPGSPPDEQEQHVQTILQTARRMQRLIQDLLDAVKIESSKLAIKPERLDPSVFLKTAVDSQTPIATEKDIDLTIEVPPALPRINGDRDRLEQALVNLLGNALKFTPPGGSVRLRAAVSDGVVKISVLDSGPGIAPGDLPHLFEPFWQSKKTAHLGAGLGLKITRAIAEAHGGTIDVSNRSTGGACFTMTIPVAATESQQRAS